MRLISYLICIICLLFLSGCFVPKHEKPLSAAMKKLVKEKGLELGSPIFTRVFKEENELEIWMESKSGKYKHLKTYKICHWSGKLGPKVKEGDKQSPEGFYIVTPSQMNPWSKYHLSFNIGYPNKYDKQHNRTGRHLMVHGGCLSAGCYAMTDNAVQEIFSLARDAFIKGQKSFAVHAFPFRMTETNLEKYKDNKWYGFWKNLKVGYNMFEKTAIPPKVGAKNGKYIFFPGNSKSISGDNVSVIGGWNSKS